MIRVRCQGKFPESMQARVMKMMLSSIVNRFLRLNRYLPNSQFIQSQICSITNKRIDECTMTMYMYTWITQDEEMRTVMNNSQADATREKKKLLKKEKDFFKNMKKVKCKGTCTICLKEGFKGVKLECGHEFHRSCIRKHFAYNPSCPNCRKRIKVS